MAREGYQAHEAFWADAKMYGTMIRRAILIGLLLQLFFIGLTLYLMDKDVYIAETNIKLSPKIMLKYHSNFFGNFDTYPWAIDPQLIPYAKGWPKLPAKIYNQMADYATGNACAAQHAQLAWGLRWSFLAYLMSILYVGVFFYQSKSQADKKYIRGAQLVPIQVLNKALAAAASESENCLHIGETVWPREMESKHLLILGTSGSGKGVLMNQLIHQINERKAAEKSAEKCIFYDLKGEFVAKQFVAGDILFCPFDSRSTGWNIFNEIEALPDFDVMAKSLFTSPDVRNEYWYNCAADVFRTGLYYLYINGKTSNKDLWDFFSLTVDKLIIAFKTLPPSEQSALDHINKAEATTSATIISVLKERIQFFKWIVDQDGKFSFRRYIRSQESGQPNLFILNIEQYSTVFKPLMTMAIDTMVRETLSLPDDLQRRIWFILDELGTLYRMDSVLKLETVGRSKGGCLICANQDLGRIEEMYGRANLKSFYNNFNTNFTFRIREPETAEFLSRAIGDQQLIKTSHSRQMSPSDVGDRRSESEQEKTERLILPVEFQGLADLEAVINIAGFGVSRLQIPPVYYPERQPNFLMRDFPILAAPQDKNQTEQDTSASKSRVERLSEI